MKKLWLAAVILALPALGAQQQQPAPAARPMIDVSGRIAKVRGGFGQGMPSLEVQTEAGRTWTVWLGSMRYLMEQNFNPKAGQEVSVKGFKPPAGQGPGCCGMRFESTSEKAADEVIACSVTLTQTKQTIRLRDDSGVPVWGGPFRGGRGRMMR